MIIKIGAIWIKSAPEMQRIHGSFSRAKLIAISDCGKYWMGKDADVAVRVGSRMDPWACDIDAAQGRESWEVVRNMLLRNKLGQPTEGSYPSPKSSGKSNSVCTCDIATVVNIGCPSAKGKPCPGARWNGY